MVPMETNLEFWIKILALSTASIQCGIEILNILF